MGEYTSEELQSIFIMQGFAGISLFSVLLLMGLGLAVIFGQMGVINMAHGELMMVGAYATYLVQNLFKAHLPEAFGLIAATHVSLCDDCRARLSALEALGGALVEDAGEMALDAGALDRVMARLEMPERRPAPRPVRGAGLGREGQ